MKSRLQFSADEQTAGQSSVCRISPTSSVIEFGSVSHLVRFDDDKVSAVDCWLFTELLPCIPGITLNIYNS
jgi:hypothetical protein